MTWQSFLGLRRIDLAGATIVAASITDSLLWGRRCTLDVVGARGITRVVVSVDAEPVVSALLGASAVVGDAEAFERLARRRRVSPR